jgi:hypothetical protein
VEWSGERGSGQLRLGLMLKQRWDGDEGSLPMRRRLGKIREGLKENMITRSN